MGPEASVEGQAVPAANSSEGVRVPRLYSTGRPESPQFSDPRVEGQELKWPENVQRQFTVPALTQNHPIPSPPRPRDFPPPGLRCSLKFPRLFLILPFTPIQSNLKEQMYINSPGDP